MAKKKKKEITINIDEDTIFKRNDEDFLNTEVDGETVMMNTLNGSYWGMNSTTTLIWSMLEKPLSFNQILNQLKEEFDVDEATCRKDTLQVLLGLNNLRIISIENNKTVKEK